MDTITAEHLIDILAAQRPKQYWEIPEDLLKAVCSLKDHAGQYLSNAHAIIGNGAITLLGYKIRVVPSGGEIRFVTEGLTK